MCKCCQLACPECYARIMNPQPPDEPVMCNGCALVRMTDGGLCIDCRIATLTRERDEARREVEELKRQPMTLGLQPLTRAEAAKLQWCVNGAWFGQPRVVATIEAAMELLKWTRERLDAYCDDPTCRCREVDALLTAYHGTGTSEQEGGGK